MQLFAARVKLQTTDVARSPFAHARWRPPPIRAARLGCSLTRTGCVAAKRVKASTAVGLRSCSNRQRAVDQMCRALFCNTNCVGTLGSGVWAWPRLHQQSSTTRAALSRLVRPCIGWCRATVQRLCFFKPPRSQLAPRPSLPAPVALAPSFRPAADPRCFLIISCTCCRSSGDISRSNS